MEKKINPFNQYPNLNANGEVTQLYKSKSECYMSYKMWLDQGRERTINRLPNEFRIEGKNNYDNYEGD